ncbi:hypothetical protein [Paraburkholderia dipogonis]|uniref:hypothetical protein n=1 Tax=Paraburkholderia dipogonis TaxID=1211383 RepID=UPI0038B818D0
MQVMTQQDGESPLPDAVPLDGIAPTPPSLAVRVQTEQPISTGHATTSLDSTNVERLHRVAALARALQGIRVAPGPSNKLRAAARLRWIVLNPDDPTPPENCGT